MLETHVMLCVAEPDFLEKKNCFTPKNWVNGPKMGQKQGFMNLVETLVIDIY